MFCLESMFRIYHPQLVQILKRSLAGSQTLCFHSRLRGWWINIQIDEHPSEPSSKLHKLQFVFFLHFRLRTDGPRELPIAVTSKQVRDVLKSELSTSVPVATPVIAVGASSNQAVPLPCKEGERHLHTPAEGALSQETPKPGGNTERNLIHIVF